MPPHSVPGPPLSPAEPPLPASVALPPIAYATGSPAPVLGAAVAASTLILIRHRSNLARVLAGTEQRVGLRLMSREP